MKGHADALIASYREASVRHRDAQEQERRRARLVAYGRIVSFTAAAACAALAWPRGALWLGAAGAGLAVAFFALVYVHSRIDARERWHDVLAQLNDEAAARVARQWDRLPRAPVAAPDPSHPYAEDLDLFGRRPCSSCSGRPAASPAAERCARGCWRPPAPRRSSPARKRSASSQVSTASGRNSPRSVAWSIRPRRISTRSLPGRPPRDGCTRPRWLVPASTAIRAAMLVLLALQVAGVIDPHPLDLPARCGRPAQRALRAPHSRHLFEGLLQAAALPAARRDVREAGGTPVHVAAPGRTPASAVELGADRRPRHGRARTAQASERPALPGAVPLSRSTRSRCGTSTSFNRWSAGSGVAGRTCGSGSRSSARPTRSRPLASLAHDNPDVGVPSIRPDGRPRHRASGLGHPLLPEDQRVVNDVEVGPPGTLLLVTGSNMSGKSTLLRSIGVNLVLAQAGAPGLRGRALAAAAAVATSMRVQDSLEAGVLVLHGGASAAEARGRRRATEPGRRLPA